MNSRNIIECIDELEFFKDFSAEEKAEVASFSHNFVLFREDSVIVQQDSNDPSLYILIEGEVILKKNEQPAVVISSLLPGSIFGTLPALPITQRNKNVITKVKSLILRLDRTMLRELNPVTINKFNTEFIKVLFRRVGEMNVTVSQERGGMARIAQAYKVIKEEIDTMPSLSEETRVISNFMYAQLKDIQKLPSY